MTFDDRLTLTPREVATWTGATLGTVRDLIAAGDLRSRKVRGRIFVDAASVRQVFGIESETDVSRPPTARVLRMVEKIAGDGG